MIKNYFSKYIDLSQKTGQIQFEMDANMFIFKNYGTSNVYFKYIGVPSTTSYDVVIKPNQTGTWGQPSTIRNLSYYNPSGNTRMNIIYYSGDFDATFLKEFNVNIDTDTLSAMHYNPVLQTGDNVIGRVKSYVQSSDNDAVYAKLMTTQFNTLVNKMTDIESSLNSDMTSQLTSTQYEVFITKLATIISTLENILSNEAILHNDDNNSVHSELVSVQYDNIISKLNNIAERKEGDRIICLTPTNNTLPTDWTVTSIYILNSGTSDLDFKFNNGISTGADGTTSSNAWDYISVPSGKEVKFDNVLMNTGESLTVNESGDTSNTGWIAYLQGYRA